MATYTEIASKADNGAFKARLRVAVTEHCRYTLGRAQGGGESADRYAWEQALARAVLYQVGHDSNLLRFARLCLLPAEWATFDPDDDADLVARVAERFSDFAPDAPPA